MSDARKEQQVTIDFEEPESVGLHPRWDPGASGWSKWRKQGHAVGITSSGWRSEEWSDENFALAVSEQPLLDDDALVLRSRGGEVGTEAGCVRCSRFIRQTVGPSVSMYWMEKLVVVVQLMQLYGLLILICETDNMLPQQWRVYVKWTHYFLLQFDETEMLDYTVSGKRQYALILLAVCSAFFVAYLAYWSYLRSNLKDRFRNRAILERMLVTAGQLVYLPIALAAARIFVCPTSGPVGLDFVCEDVSGGCKSEISCTEISHYVCMGVAAIATLLIVLGVPACVCWAVHYGVIHDNVKRHARDLRCREAERLLGLSNVWENIHYHLFSSFTRLQAGFKIRTMATLAACAISSVVLAPDIPNIQSDGLEKDRMLQIGCFTGFVLLDFIFDLTLGGFPYRHASSNWMMFAFKLNLMFTSVYACLRGFNLTNSFLVDRKLSAFLKVQSCFVALWAVVVVIWCLVNQIRSGASVWMTSHKSLYRDLDEGHEEIKAIRYAQAACARYEMSLPEFVDVQLLNKLIIAVQEQLPKAEARDSLFISTLREALTALVEIRSRAGTSSYFHRLENLRSSMATFRQRLDARDKSLIFLPRAKKMMLLKLCAVRFLMGNRKFAPLPEWQTKFEYGQPEVEEGQVTDTDRDPLPVA